MNDMSEWCLIISGAPYCYIPPNVQKADFIIACDKGYIYAQRASLKPDLVIGDFDSFRGDIPPGIDIIRTVPEKDDTDTLMALKEALKRGYKKIVITGGLGGRLDHTIANLSLTAFAAQRGAMCCVIDKDHQAFAIKNKTCRIKRGKWANVSVFSMDRESKGVTLRGLKYPLTDAVVTNMFPIGVSNEFAEDTASISVKDGMLLIILSDFDE